MAKAYMSYASDDAQNFAFLQDTAIAAGVGNSPMGGSVAPKLPHFFKPRKVTVKIGGAYRQYVVGSPDFAGITDGQTMLAGTVVGKVGEKHFSTGA